MLIKDGRPSKGVEITILVVPDRWAPPAIGGTRQASRWLGSAGQAGIPTAIPGILAAAGLAPHIHRFRRLTSIAGIHAFSAAGFHTAALPHRRPTRATPHRPC